MRKGKEKEKGKGYGKGERGGERGKMKEKGKGGERKKEGRKKTAHPLTFNPLFLSCPIHKKINTLLLLTEFGEDSERGSCVIFK